MRGKIKITDNLSSSETHINISLYSCKSKSLATSDEVIQVIILSKERKQSIPEKMAWICRKSWGFDEFMFRREFQGYELRGHPNQRAQLISPGLSSF